ncbi:hypothetical protein K435DRAFT_116124 [Dendrothele bispora CBS 962.96]|uniref:NGN domain-containing protein n=1 Tax=Dendrothele bispora (strain CBS 962.96) TaxID=1314807 RepID=A0A4S8MQU8_DENBC|nr:hypothetical protein K435DRAFT_116124 [Dendrothele bispora CBS 962.96]
MSPKNQNPRFLDLEAGDDSDEGLSELAQNSGNEDICDEETDEESDSEEERPSARVRWNEDIEGIEKRFTNRDRLEVGTNDKVDLPEESLVPDCVPAERWPVWEVKCQKGAESEVVRSLYQSFDAVNPPDLRSAFYASSLSSRIYLEARAMGPGTPVYKTLLNTPFVRKQMNSSGSLQVKSWRPVSFEVASHCLAIRSLELAGGTGSSEGSTFAKYDWVTIRQGRYKGDPALVLRDFETPVYWDKRSGKLVDEQWLGSSTIDSTHLEFHLQRQVQVLLIPRLELTSSDSDDGGKGPRLKRKAAPVGRPEPALFAFTQLLGVSPHSQRESAEKTYTHRGRKYQHGLLYQTFSPSKLQKGAHLSAATIRLFQTSNHPVVKQARFPSQRNRNIWHFQNGDCVEMLTSSETGQKQGHENAEVLSTTDWRSGGTIRDIKDDFCEVEFTKGETYYVPCSSLVKVFALGDYVEVVGGAYRGRTTSRLHSVKFTPTQP